MRISEWLARHVDYANLHDSPALRESFRVETGYTPPAWREEAAAAARTDAFLGQPVRVDAGVPDVRVICYGIEVAQAIEQEFVPGLRPENEHYSGRGRNFDAIVATLRRAGL